MLHLGCILDVSQINGLRDGQCIIDLDPEVSDGAVHLRMTEEQLHGPRVAGLLVNLCDLRPPHGMRAVAADLQSDRADPLAKKSGILARRHVGPVVEPARPEILHSGHGWAGDPLL